MKNYIQKRLKEEIRASEAYNTIDSINTLIHNKRDVAFVSLLNFDIEEMKKILNNHNLLFMKVPSTENIMTYVIYKPEAHLKAKELWSIAKKYNGYLYYKSSEDEARRIGQLLGYNKNDIEEFIKQNY